MRSVGELQKLVEKLLADISLGKFQLMLTSNRKGEEANDGGGSHVVLCDVE